MISIEITLYDRFGRAIAYIADDMEATIYLWSGDAVAYILAGRVYGWVGKHLGWFENGVLYDLMDHRVGFTHQTCPVTPNPDPPKFPKRAKYIKSPRLAPIARSIPEYTLSHQDLATFLKFGLVE